MDTNWPIPQESKQDPSNTWVISQQNENAPPPSPKLSLKTIGIVLGMIVLVGGIGSVSYMIVQTTQTVNKAAEKQASEISNLLTEINPPSSSFNLVSQVQAQEYQNPLDPATSYSNPFSDTQNPFK